MTPNPRIVIPTGSYAGILNIVGSSKPGYKSHPRNGATERMLTAFHTPFPHPHDARLIDGWQSWQLSDQLWINQHRPVGRANAVSPVWLRPNRQNCRRGAHQAGPGSTVVAMRPSAAIFRPRRQWLPAPPALPFRNPGSLRRSVEAGPRRLRSQASSDAGERAVCRSRASATHFATWTSRFITCRFGRPQ